MRPARYAVIVGLAGVLATYVAWRVIARRALHVNAAAEDTVQHCLRADDPIFGKAIEKSRQQILALMKERRIPGMSISVSVDERLVWSEGFGDADADAHTPACPDTRFRLGSVSKPITATAMARLYDEGPTEDLVKFGNALLPRSRMPILRAQTRAMLFKPETHLVPFVFGYALGWMTTRDLDLRHVYMHFGAGSGTTAWMGVFPDQRVVVAVLANLGHADFTYASTLGVGARFASRPLLAPIVVLLMVFSAFFALTYAVAWTILRTRR